jgi:hypothetical protein
LHRSPKNTSAAGKGLQGLGQKPACGGRLYGERAGQGASSWKSRCSQSKLSVVGAGRIFAAEPASNVCEPFCDTYCK